MGYDYDAQIERITKDPSEITGEWWRAEGLFACRKANHTSTVRLCLTQYRLNADTYSQTYIDQPHPLILAVINDKRIPSSMAHIRPKMLPAFKEHCLALDAAGL